MCRGSIALVGSGEYLAEMHPMEAALIADGVARGKAARFVQLATAAGQEGDDRLAYWRRIGAEQGERIGVEVDFLPVFDRDHALDPAFADRVSDSALVYFSGGDPGYLAECLRDTPLWHAIERNFRTGGSLAGCSAGAMFLAEQVPSLRFLHRSAVPGMGLLPNLLVLPHFDMIHRWIPDVLVRMVTHMRDGDVLVGIDEMTAIVDDGNGWQVWGSGRAHLLTGAKRAFSAGERFPAPQVRSDHH